MLVVVAVAQAVVHCRIGSSEMFEREWGSEGTVHCRIGSSENWRARCGDAAFRSLPHRQLRKPGTTSHASPSGSLPHRQLRNQRGTAL